MTAVRDERDVNRFSPTRRLERPHGLTVALREEYTRSVPTLLVRALMTEIGDLAKAKGFSGSRVLHKVNARGELVLAVVIAPTTPGEWGPPTPPPPRVEATAPDAADSREAKRLARLKRS